jgi:hypothetical protein
VDEPLDVIHPTVLRPDVFPEIGSAVVVLSWRVATALLVALIEREKPRILAGEFRRVVDFVLIDREMRQYTAFESEDGFARVAVLAVLLSRVPICLISEGILQFGRRNVNTVDAQSEVYTQVGVRGRRTPSSAGCRTACSCCTTRRDGCIAGKQRRKLVDATKELP